MTSPVAPSPASWDGARTDSSTAMSLGSRKPVNSWWNAATARGSFAGYQSITVPVAKRSTASRSPRASRANSPGCSNGGSTNTTPRLRRQQRFQDRPAVEAQDLCLRVSGKEFRQLLTVLRMKLVDDEAIRAAHEPAGQQWAARIRAQIARGNVRNTF